jgi:hypothetical protein
MHIEFLVEDMSTEVALQGLLPRMLEHETTFRLHTLGSKPVLLRKLPRILRGYSSWLPPDYRVVVLVDEDRQDCVELKSRLDQVAREAGLTTLRDSRLGGELCQCVCRIAVEELEAWFFGDWTALRTAYPRLLTSPPHRAKYRHPDSIGGGTWEQLEILLQRAGYYLTGIPKIEVARRVAVHMEPKRNTSHSFQVFREALNELRSVSSAPDATRGETP